MKETKRGVLIYNLDDYYNQKSFKNAVNADNMAVNIDTLYDKVFRNMIKNGKWHDGKKVTPAQYKIVERIWDLTYEHFNDKE